MWKQHELWDGTYTLDALVDAAELRSARAAGLAHAAVLRPAGPNPVMTAGEWTWPELRHDLPACLTLAAEEIAWTLEGFFGEGGPNAPPAGATMSP